MDEARRYPALHSVLAIRVNPIRQEANPCMPRGLTAEGDPVAAIRVLLRHLTASNALSWNRTRKTQAIVLQRHMQCQASHDVTE